MNNFDSGDIPADLLAKCDQLNPDWRDTWPDRKRIQYLSYCAHLALVGGVKRHLRDPEAGYIYSGHHRKTLGRTRVDGKRCDVFSLMNEQTGFIQLGEHYRRDWGECLTAKATAAFVAVYRDVLDNLPEGEPVAILSISGSKARPKRAAISAPRGMKRPDIPVNQPVNVQALKAGIKTLEACKDGLTGLQPMPERLPRFLEHASNPEAAIDRRIAGMRDVIMRANSSIGPIGAIQCVYRMAPSGRYYGTGRSPQNMPREVKQAAFWGCYEYDVDNCHATVMRQLAIRISGDPEAFPHLQQYIDNKRQWRADIARAVGISVEQAKTLLIAKLYGGGDDAISEILDDDASKVSALCSNVHWQAFSGDDRAASAVIVGYARQQCGRSKYVTNCNGGKIAAKSPDNEILAHLLQGHEAQILRAIANDQGDNMALCMHDGYVFREPVSIQHQQNIIRLKTGFDVSISGGQMAPKWTEFVKPAVQFLQVSLPKLTA